MNSLEGAFNAGRYEGTQSEEIVPNIIQSVQPIIYKKRLTDSLIDAT